jgi:hypothetical protein
MHSDPPLSTVGEILGGKEAGRFVEVLDDSARTGGYLIFTYADAQRSPEVFDIWAETWDDVEQIFREASWRIAWPTSP